MINPETKVDISSLKNIIGTLSTDAQSELKTHLNELQLQSAAKTQTLKNYVATLPQTSQIELQNHLKTILPHSPEDYKQQIINIFQTNTTQRLQNLLKDQNRVNFLIKVIRIIAGLCGLCLMFYNAAIGSLYSKGSLENNIDTIGQLGYVAVFITLAPTLLNELTNYLSGNLVKIENDINDIKKTVGIQETNLQTMVNKNIQEVELGATNRLQTLATSVNATLGNQANKLSTEAQAALSQTIIIPKVSQVPRNLTHLGPEYSEPSIQSILPSAQSNSTGNSKNLDTGGVQISIGASTNPKLASQIESILNE